jgi:drug/metabolite transporter (DMT)-like permease
MLVFYWIGALAFLPFSNFTLLVDLTLLQWTLVIFCGLNTLVAYGCFSEALMHIEASRVSAVIAMTPLITVFFVQSVPFAGVVAEPIGLVTIIGAACVVSGSLVTATMKNKT